MLYNNHASTTQYPSRNQGYWKVEKKER